ncbi:MAG: hypothetical protein IKS29_00880 [Oscillospiraceae bacterium]|nr:hypothetical protein [Oscillospiraceae bacterium]
MKRNQLKVVLSLVLCIALICALFAACSKKTDTPANNTTPSTNTNTNEPTKPADSGEPQTFDEEPTEVIFYMFDMRGTGNDYGGNAKQAAHDYVLEKVNVDLDIHFVSPGDWANTVPVALSAGERIDVCSLFGGTGIARAYPKGLLMDINI